MKKYSSLILAALLLATVGVTIASTLWEGSLTTVSSATAYSPTNTVAAVDLQGGTYIVSTGGVGAGSNLIVNEQWSFDGTNFGTVATWTPAVTNAGSVSWPVGALTPSIWQRFQITTVGSVGVGILQP